jgi:hypothetical protein
MFTIIAGTVLLAMVHALIPNHWLPLVAVARAEQWSRKDVTTVTLLAALAHVTGTVALGLVLGFIGKELVEKYGTAIHVGSSVLLIVFGLVYYTVLSVVYALVSISGILLLVRLGYKGVNLLPASFIEHNEKRISGTVLILAGIASFFLH